jgi:hypothetical protein
MIIDGTTNDDDWKAINIVGKTISINGQANNGYV